VFMLCSSRERGTVGSLRAFPFLIFWFEPLESKRVEKVGEKEKSCRKMIKEEGDSFGENFIVFHFVSFLFFWATNREQERENCC
jgi:hypothetical protein